jgi:ABC-2 type transport system ATP-binding protein
MRMMAGLVTPTSGSATINGRRYQELPNPTSVVGAVLDSSNFHPAHTARRHLQIYRTMGGHPRNRVDEVIEQLGIAEFGNRPTRGFSTGMRQRLNLATALLGNPRVLLLDEPSNGLDPEGIAWLRDLLRSLAAEGRTVLVSSHVLSEVEQTVDRVVVIRRGELVTAGPITELAAATRTTVIVQSPNAVKLGEILRAQNPGLPVEVRQQTPEEIHVEGISRAEIADIAAEHSVPVHGLSTERSSLEQVFLQLTADQGENR